MSILRTTPRRGFTLIELIVVISIIAVMVTLSAAAILKFTGGAQTSATRTLLQRVDAMLRKQVATTNDRARKEIVPDPVLLLAGGDADRASVIWLKLKLKQKYPVSFAEVFAPAPGYLTPVPAYVKHLQQHGITSGNNTPQPHESAACLLMALSVGPDGISESELSMGGSTKVINGVPCLVDAWGNPVTFCRWPTGQAGTGVSALYGTGYNAGYTDPGDPKNTLLTNWSGRQEFLRVCHPLPTTRPPTNQAKPMLLSLVVVSWGPDELSGLNPQTLESLGGTDSDDNIFSAEVR